MSKSDIRPPEGGFVHVSRIRGRFRCPGIEGSGLRLGCCKDFGSGSALLRLVNAPSATLKTPGIKVRSGSPMHLLIDFYRGAHSGDRSWLRTTESILGGERVERRLA